MKNSYQEYRPSAALGRHVACYWSAAVTATKSSVEYRVLPDGCIDIIFEFKPSGRLAGKMVGTMTQPLLFCAVEPMQMVAVRFRPGGAVPFLGLSANEITDQQDELPQFWTTDELADQIYTAATTAKRVRLVERLLLKRLADTSPLNERVQAAVTKFQTQTLRVDQVAKAIGVSRQQLTRLFGRHVGVGPKVFARVSRIQNLQTTIQDSPAVDWAKIALQSGYFDQAHMINECRSLTGLSPGELSEH